MSPSLRDQVVLAVYPGRVCWLRLEKGLRPRVAGQGTLVCAEDADASWHGAVKLVPEALRAAVAAGANVRVLLSNRFVRYAITSNPDGARSQEELDLLARHAFKRVHGEAAAAWNIRLSEASPGKPALASAIDQALLDALRAAIQSAGASLMALQPYLMAAFNRFGRQLPGRDGLFVVAEPSRICQLMWKDGGWCAVQQMNVGPDWSASLHGMLDRLAMTAGFQDRQVLQLCAPELPEQGFELAPWHIHVLRQRWPSELSPIQDKAYAGALMAMA